MYFENRIGFFHARNIGSVGQRAAKLLAVKVGVLKKKSAAKPGLNLNSRPGRDSDWVTIILKV